MRHSLRVRTVFVAVITLVSLYELIANWGKHIRLGADLRGGTHLVLQVAWREAGSRDPVMRETREVILKKVNALGLSEATAQPVGRPGAEDQLLVELPGVDDPARVKRIIGTAAVLEWLEVKAGPFATREEAGWLPLGSQALQVQNGPWFVLAKNPVVRGTDLRDARSMQTQERGWVTTFVLSQTAAKRFETYTAANIGRRAAIVLDRKIISVPVIEGRIGDTGEIAGARSGADAADLALNLRAGSMPARITFLEERTVGPALGADSITNGLRAGIGGVAAVVTVMTIYYKRSGVQASVALALNALLLLAALSYFEAVLTLPGIAGLILTIGMAVDSNVLVFERIREELRAGKTAAGAVDAGFRRAFQTILDTHVTTVFACVCLFYFGTIAVRGFAITLAIGLAANVFTALFVSRLWFDWELWKAGPRARISI